MSGSRLSFICHFHKNSNFDMGCRDHFKKTQSSKNTYMKCEFAYNSPKQKEPINLEFCVTRSEDTRNSHAHCSAAMLE